MPEQNQSLYQRYLSAVRAHPEAYVVVKDGNRLVAFQHECWLFAQELGGMPVNVNGHSQLRISPAQVERLKAKYDILEV